MDYTPDEDGRVVHYGPGDRPLCGSESMTAVYTDEPALVSGCRDCLHCRQEITVRGGLEWRRTVRRPCPHCGKPGW